MLWNNVTMVVSFRCSLDLDVWIVQFWSVVPKKGRIHVLVLVIVLICWFDWNLLCSASDGIMLRWLFLSAVAWIWMSGLFSSGPWYLKKEGYMY